jgi:thymidine kinase
MYMADKGLITPQRPPKHPCGTLTVIVGPMFAGKSSEAMRQLRRHELARQSCLLIKHASDDARLTDETQVVEEHFYAIEGDASEGDGLHYRRSPVYLHDSDGACMPPGQSYTAVSVSTLGQVPNALVAEAQFLFVDEAQWFPDLVHTVRDWVRLFGKHVYVYGIDSDKMQRPMDNMAHLTFIADHVRHRRAVCVRCGRDTASLSIKKHDADAEEGAASPIEPGGTNVYEARCFGCLDDQTYAAQQAKYRKGDFEFFHINGSGE